MRRNSSFSQCVFLIGMLAAVLVLSSCRMPALPEITVSDERLLTTREERDETEACTDPTPDEETGIVTRFFNPSDEYLHSDRYAGAYGRFGCGRTNDFAFDAIATHGIYLLLTAPTTYVVGF